jgi:hypothetical protein
MTASLASRLRTPGVVALAGAALGAALLARDPHVSGAWGYCPILLLTGYPCPACGGLRAANDLTRGDFVGAVSSNVLAVALVAALSVAWVLWVVRRLRGKANSMIMLNLPAGLVLIGVIVVFGVVRNTPWGSWLAP